MTTGGQAVSAGQRVFYAAVGVLALWVGAWGMFAPARVDWALPWPVPPLHARFLGAMYLSGATFMAGALLARRWSRVRVVVPMVAVWTGWLLLVSVLHPGEFDWRRPQVWFWFGAYALYPVLAAVLAWRHRRDTAPGPGPATPLWLGRYLLLQGVLCVLLGAALFLFPTGAARLWPWPITPLLAQLYSAPFLSYGLGSLYASRQAGGADLRLFLLATLVFTAGVLVASVRHRALFGVSRVSTWLWFLAFAGATVALYLGLWRACAPGPGTPESSGPGGARSP